MTARSARDRLAEGLAGHEPLYCSSQDGEPDWFVCVSPADDRVRCGWRSDPESEDIAADFRKHVADALLAPDGAVTELIAEAEQRGFERGQEDLRQTLDLLRIRAAAAPKEGR